MPVVRGIRVLNAISTGNVTPSCLNTLLSDPGRLADVTQVLSSPSYSCMLAQSNTAAWTAMRSNNAMTAIFANPVASCVLYTTPNGRDDMLGSDCYYNYMMSFSTPEASNAFFHLGNSPTMLDAAFASNTQFLTSAVQSNTEMAKLLSCNSSVSACFRGSNAAMCIATGIPDRAAYWLDTAPAFSCLFACCHAAGVAFGNTNFQSVLNRNVACVMCTPQLNCCAWGRADSANSYIKNACAVSEVVNKGACCLSFTSCNFVCWYASCFGMRCLIDETLSGNTFFLDQVYNLNSWRQKSCLYYMCDSAGCACSCWPACSANTFFYNAQCLIKAEYIARCGNVCERNDVIPANIAKTTSSQRICNFCIVNGSQLSNTEIEYMGKFSKCNYNVITHADARFTLVSPGFWTTSNMIAAFRDCYCCVVNRTTANTSGLTIDCGLYYTINNGQTFNRLSYCIPGCIFQSVCGTSGTSYSVRHALSSFACCNYVYTGWIITDCADAWFKTGHSRVCLFANSEPDHSTWTHFPDVPLPFYTITFCDEYFAGVSPMRTDGYQTTLGGACHYAMMFSFGRVGECVRVSCDNFVNCVPTNVCCFTPSLCTTACASLPACTNHSSGIAGCGIWNTCREDYFQAFGTGNIPAGWCFCTGCSSWQAYTGITQIPQPIGQSFTLIWKNSACAQDSKAFLAGWRTYGMMYGGPVGGQCAGTAPLSTCAVVDGRCSASCFSYLYCNSCGIASGGVPGEYSYFSSSPGLNVWCYGAQANNTMQGSEINCEALGGTANSWTNWSFSNVKIVGNVIAIAGSIPPQTLVPYTAACTSGGCATYCSYSFSCPGFGCQGGLGQIHHTTVMNANGVVGTTVCCLDSMYHQQPYLSLYDGCIQFAVAWCEYCTGRRGCCLFSSHVVNCFHVHLASPPIAATAGLKTINLYGTGNSVYSFAAFPNISPFAGGIECCHNNAWSPRLGAYDSNRQARSIFAIEGLCCSLSINGYCSACNPGSDTVILRFGSNDTSIGPAVWLPWGHCAIYTPPSANQNMAEYNFCYVLAPHHDLCLTGPFCFNISCPSCNSLLCCSAGPGNFICCQTRAFGYPKQQVYVNYLTSQLPCVSYQSNPCNCRGWGNHHAAVAQANSTWQCAAVDSGPYKCSACSVFEIYCSGTASTCGTQHSTTYVPMVRTCNQSGGNCMWFDYFESVSGGGNIPGAGTSVGSVRGYGGCSRIRWNNYWRTDVNFCDLAPVPQCYGLLQCQKTGAFMTQWSHACTFSSCDGTSSVTYPIPHSRMTRGSGGYTNTQNSVHVAYFDLVPFRCFVCCATEFYANGNPCPSFSGLVCCLKYVKTDFFYNL